jgi:hypothetical protein
VIKSSDGYIFGGYASDSWSAWDSTNTTYPRLNKAPGSFIFTITNPHGILPTKYQPKGMSAIKNHYMSGPCFGDDINITSNCNDHSNHSWFPFHYLDTTGAGCKTFTGSRYFRVKDIEVFTH